MDETEQAGLTYARLHPKSGPNSLVAEALDIVRAPSGRALDIGAGPLNDTSYLLQAGLEVEAVDTDPYTLTLAAEMNDPRLTVVHADVRDVTIAPAAYRLVVAIHLFPFLPRADLGQVAHAITDGLCGGGVLCCTFLGREDSWARTRPHMTFMSAAQVLRAFPHLRLVTLREERYDGLTAARQPKRWHVFRCLFRKD
ncbi:class I SAM-dependent methyltransferase [Nonomuraea sp. NPDC004580]|uniref:class I SAM-dependent methyltransferase n=1 Tax=Nonomuraea sp. NPDC004580 TaxID=3154552 RepID=UPI0033A5D8E3